MRKLNVVTLVLLFLSLFSLIGCGEGADCLEYTLLDDGTYAVGLKEEYSEIYSGEIVEDTEWHQLSFSGGSTYGKKIEKVNKNIIIPETYQDKPVTKIMDFGFCNYVIDSIKIPDSVTMLGKGAFFCSAGIQINIPEGIKIISDYAFYGCSMIDITIPNSVKELGKYAFGENDFTSVTLPEGLEKIGDCAFVSCHNLEKIMIPSSVQKMGEYLFYNYNYHQLPALTNVKDILYKGNASSWKEIEISEKSIDSSISICYYYEEANIFDYLEAQEKGDKIWCYDSSNEPTLVEFTVTNTIENKSYIYSNTEVIISDDYWSMLESAKAEGMLEEVLDPETLAVYNKSIDKESFQANLIINFQEKYQLKYKIDFKDGKVTTYYLSEQLTYPLEYIEVDSSEIYYVMSEKIAYTIKEGRICEDLSNEYITVKHYFEVE